MAATQQQDPAEISVAASEATGRQKDRKHTQHGQQDSLNQEQNPVLVNRRSDGGGNPFDVGPSGS